MLHVFRRHWRIPVKDALNMTATMPIGFAISAALDWIASAFGWLQVALWVLVAWHQGKMVWHLLTWRAEVFVITNKRLVRTYGVVTHSMTDWKLNRVTNVSKSCTFAGETLNYGTIRLESGGLHDDGAKRERVTDVPNPTEVERLIQLARLGGAK